MNMRRMIFALAFCVAASTGSFASDSNIGSWKLNESKSKILNGEEATRFQWLSHIENYDINIEQTDTLFFVYFSPTVRGDPPIILGGVVKYEIDRKTFQVASKTAIK